MDFRFAAAKVEEMAMCGGVEAREADKVWKIYFPNPKAALPVLLEESGQLDWITWGRRTEQPGYGPTGGWAKLSTVQAGGWAKYDPRRGLAMVQRFMEKEGQPGEKNRPSHWFDVPEGWAVECLVIGGGGAAAGLCSNHRTASRACMDS